jgi:hypothetical protein
MSTDLAQTPYGPSSRLLTRVGMSMRWRRGSLDGGIVLVAYNTSALCVTVDGGCIDAGFTVQPCNGSGGQLWTISSDGAVLNQARPGQCLRSGSAISFTADDCPPGPSRSRRWNRPGLAANGNGGPVSNIGVIQGEDRQRCAFVNGASVSLRQPCLFTTRRVSTYSLLRCPWPRPWPAVAKPPQPPPTPPRVTDPSVSHSPPPCSCPSPSDSSACAGGGSADQLSSVCPAAHLRVARGSDHTAR